MSSIRQYSVFNTVPADLLSLTTPAATALQRQPPRAARLRIRIRVAQRTTAEERDEVFAGVWEGALVPGRLSGCAAPVDAVKLVG